MLKKLSIVLQLPHLEHAAPTQEIQRLSITSHCKRKAEEDNAPLRQVFDQICRQSSQEAAQQLSFPSIESSMYKRRRLAQPALPTTTAEADNIVRDSRYAQINGELFYRGVADAHDNGSALLFASEQQLELLKSAGQVYFDATFKVVPALYYQLFTIFAPHADATFPVLYALMTRKTQALYRAVFEMLKALVPDFAPTLAMADFEDAPVSAFQEVFGNVAVAGCWFHYAQAIVKRLQKAGLKEAYQRQNDVKDTVQCLICLPLLPGREIEQALYEVRAAISSDVERTHQLQQLVAYVKRQWIDKATVGPDRLSVRDCQSRTNNIMESYHAALRRRIIVTHPNLFVFLGHLQRATTDYMTDMARVRNGLSIRRPRRKAAVQNDARIQTCIRKFDGGSYSRMQFLRAVSHSLGAHTAALQVLSDSTDDDDADAQQPTATAVATAASTSDAEPAADNNCEVCLLVPRSDVALVPCGHSRFCATCADTVAAMGNGCPICRTRIEMVLRVFV